DAGPPEKDRAEAPARPAELRRVVRPFRAERLTDERRRRRSEGEARREGELQDGDDVRVRGAVHRLFAATVPADSAHAARVDLADDPREEREAGHHRDGGGRGGDRET